MNVPRIVLAFALLLVVSSAGCALALDYGPPGPDTSAVGTLDSGFVRVDGGDDAGNVLDGAAFDAGDVRRDAMVMGDVAIVTTPDGAGLRDAARDGSRFDATTNDAARIDAASTDAGVDTAMSDGGPVCNGVHPIVGTARTCDPGSCLCVDIDLCFTVDVASACCAGRLACAPPVPECMPSHPIIGPPRTCVSGECYCSDPDACFPADRAARCCAVGVVCVP